MVWTARCGPREREVNHREPVERVRSLARGDWIAFEARLVN